eukprot:COSAG01_NODE_13571_length_1566_cov_1.245399_2_plen_80_part_00
MMAVTGVQALMLWTLVAWMLVSLANPRGASPNGKALGIWGGISLVFLLQIGLTWPWKRDHLFWILSPIVGVTLGAIFLW